MKIFEKSKKFFGVSFWENQPSESEVAGVGKRQELEWEVILPYFDEEYYLEKYQDIDKSKVNPAEHYFYFGWREGRNPSSVFSNDGYLRAHKDVNDAGVNPLLHYVLYGCSEGRLVPPAESDIEEKEQPDDKEELYTSFSSEELESLLSKNMDIEYYKRNYPDVRENEIDPVQHYMLFGWKEGRNPSANFNTKKYFRENVGIPEGVNPFLHYLIEGKGLGFRAYPATDITSDGLKKLAKVKNSSLIQSSGIKPFIPERFTTPEPGFNYKMMNIHWVIPDFSKGGGGHMTIFRFIRWFELFGHNCTIWIMDPTVSEDENQAYEKIVKHFQTVRAEVNFITSSNFPEVGDAVIATSWQTVSIVESLTGFKEKFYFVQDFEPYFYARGSESILAEETYRKGLSCLCASPWLHKRMEGYGAWARPFMLAYDHNIYYPDERARRQNKKKKIAVYSRVFTERRAVELAFAGLELLSYYRDDFEVHLFGSDLDRDAAPFDCIVHGILSPGELADLYNECDIGVCFSATNYSLVPQEMMACNLPLIELDVESTRAIYPTEAVTFAKPSAQGVCDAIIYLLENEKIRDKQALEAAKWVCQFSWEDSARQVEQAIREKIAESWDEKHCQEQNAVKVSVVIPTYNGGELLFHVIDKVLAQRAPWKFELIIIDSSSSDGTPSRLEKLEGVRFYSIDQADFGHGKTRNYGVQLSEGDYIAFLTQDAIPYDEYWLYNMVAMLEHYPNAAGVFGKHLAHDDASLFTKHELNEHFRNIEMQPLVLSKSLDFDRYIRDERWRQLLHFYSDNSSCLRRSVWEKIPYRDIKYGEDQVWAHDIIEAGFEKLYCPSSVVKHSHDYSDSEIFERSKVDGDYFSYFWGYSVVPNTREELNRLISDVKEDTLILGTKLGVSMSRCKQQVEISEQRLRGLFAGQNRKESIFSAQNKEKSKF